MENQWICKKCSKSDFESVKEYLKHVDDHTYYTCTDCNSLLKISSKKKHEETQSHKRKREEQQELEYFDPPDHPEDPVSVANKLEEIRTEGKKQSFTRNTLMIWIMTWML